MSYKMSTRRKLAIATWSSPSEGNIYGKLTIDMRGALGYMHYLREEKSQKITITHLVGKAVGLALKRAPDLNGRILFGKYIPHKTVDLAFLVALPDGSDLAKFKVCNIDQKTTFEIAQELTEGALSLRNGKNTDFQKSTRALKYLPVWLLRPVLWATGYITAAMGFDMKPFGLERFPFGVCIVTSVGMLGIDEGFAPPTPFARVPIYLVVTRVKDRPVVDDGQIAIRPELDLMATIDHRFMDGFQGAVLAKTMRHFLESPWLMDGYTEKPFKG